MKEDSLTPWSVSSEIRPIAPETTDPYMLVYAASDVIDGIEGGSDEKDGLERGLL